MTQPRPPDHNLIYTDTQEYQRQTEAWHQYQMQQALANASAPIIRPLAQMARSQAMQAEEFKDVWASYTPEIDAYMQKVPEQHRADPGLWNEAAAIVAGKHYKELARKEAERLASTGDTGTISGGGAYNGSAPPTSDPSDPIDALFREDHPAVQKFKRVGKSAQDVKRHAAQMGYDLDKYAEVLKRKANVGWSQSGSPKNEFEASHAGAVNV